MTNLYLAYGSNLDKRGMRTRCPTAIPLKKTVMLTNARLVFRGVADVELCRGSKVPCGVWTINRQDEVNLDRYEGVASGMYSKYWLPITHMGRKRKALIYMMNSRGIYPPSQYYIDVIRKGYKDFGLDEKYLDEAVERSFDKKIDDQVIDRRSRQKKDGKQRRLVSMPDKVWQKHLEDVARQHIEKFLGDIGEVEDIREEAHCLGFDALINVKGVSDHQAAKIAAQVAKEYE